MVSRIVGARFPFPQPILVAGGEPNASDPDVGKVNPAMFFSTEIIIDHHWSSSHPFPFPWFGQVDPGRTGGWHGVDGDPQRSGTQGVRSGRDQWWTQMKGMEVPWKFHGSACSCEEAHSINIRKIIPQKSKTPIVWSQNVPNMWRSLIKPWFLGVFDIKRNGLTDICSMMFSLYGALSCSKWHIAEEAVESSGIGTKSIAPRTRTRWGRKFSTGVRVPVVGGLQREQRQDF